MRALTWKAGPLYLWQALVLLIVFGGAGAGTFALTRGDGAAAGGLAASEQLVAARRGPLVNAISTSGSVVFPEREVVTFKVSGEVEEVLVSQGEVALEGQTLARVVSSARASLERAVADAEVQLRDARKALADAEQPAALAVADADAKLRDARTALADALRPDALAVANAEVKLQDARKALADALAASNQEAVADAEAALARSRTALENARADLAVARKTESDDAAAGRKTFADAEKAYKDVFAQWLGIALADGDSLRSPADLLAGWGVDLDAALAPLQFGGDYQRSESLTPPEEDPSTPWSDFVVFSWVFFPGPVVGTCENDEPPAMGRCADKEMKDAWDALESARGDLDKMLARTAGAALAAERGVADAETALQRAEDALADAQAGDAALAAQRRAAVADAEDALEDANTVDAVTVAQRRAAVADAEQALEDAKTVDAVTVAQRRAAVADAEQALNDAKAVDPLIVALRRTEVSVAEHALQTARDELAGADLTAPIAGLVEDVSIKAGDLAQGRGDGAARPSITVADLSIVEVNGDVDEVDVLEISVGVSAEVTLSALPGRALTGEITEIGAATTSQSGVVTFPVKVRLDVPADLSLREGLSATARVTLAEYRDVLLIPTAAVVGSVVAPTARVWSDGSVEERPIRIGATDGFWVVALEGLEEGDQVVMPEPAAANSFGGFGAFGGPRGGPRGGPEFEGDF